MELFSDTMMRLFSAQKPILPPFDALLLPYIRGSNILAIAQHASRALQANIVPLSPAWFFPEHTRADPLRVGMISYDVNNHPTAHLMEAIIEECRLLQPMAREVQIYVFSYGRDDNSTYRRNIQQGAFRFIDLALLGYQEAAEVIRSEMIDVLLEMQLHTLGHRMQITAYHPAPVQVCITSA